MDTIRAYRSFDRPVQVLLANYTVNNVAFYMLVPFLAGYMADGLGFAAWTVGLVLGIRTLTQQGLFLIGGSFADRVGCKPTIVVGSALRVVGFGLFGLADSATGMIVASALSGFAGSLLSPATRAYLAQETSGERRVEAFALFNVSLHAGSLVGPLIGTLLIAVDFRTVAFAAAGLFVLVAALQLAFLPRRDVDAGVSSQTVFRDWGEVLSNRAFVLFSLSMLGNFTLYNQVYLGLPLEVRRLTGGDGGVGLLFAVLALFGIVGQVPVTACAKNRLRPGTAIALGMLLMGLAFVPLVLAADLLPIDAAAMQGTLARLGVGAGDAVAGWVAGVVNLAPLLTCAAVLSFGTMVNGPFIQGTISSLARGRLVGTYFGMYSVGQGVGATLGNLAGGATFDVAAAVGWAGLPWLLMVVLGLACAAGIVALDRRGLLDEPPRARTTVPATTPA